MRYIDIEGTDGCGKATQTKLLYDYLVSKGYKCKIVSFPNYDSSSSVAVKMYLNGELGDNNSLNCYQSSLPFIIDRLITMKQISVKDYDYIIFDRYTPSNMIHQSTKIEKMDELENFLDWCEDLEYNKLDLPIPNDTLFLDVPPEVSIRLARERSELKNGQAKDILEEDDSHLYKAYERAKYVAIKFNWTRIDCIDYNGLKSIATIHREIIKALNL